MSLPGHLVQATWLREHLGSPGLVVADARWEPDGSGPEKYGAGHIPGAVYLDADRDLAARPFVDGPGRHPLPAPEVFAETMSATGIGDADAVVSYDAAGGSIAARVWWMLRVTGHECAVLDGGLDAWNESLETGPVVRSRATFTPSPWPESDVVDAEEVAETLRHDHAIVLDARVAERYRAESELIDPVAGHIPGAVSAPWASNLDPATGRFLSPDELRRRYEELGVVRAEDAVAYCGSGITATHDLLAMEVAGLGRGRLYEGSWSGWIDDPTRPVATGD